MQCGADDEAARISAEGINTFYLDIVNWTYQDSFYEAPGIAMLSKLGSFVKNFLSSSEIPQDGVFPWIVL